MKTIYVQTKDGPKPFNIPWKVIFILAGILVLLVVGGSSYYRVEADEVGVVQRFGAFHRETPPGLHFKWPWGIESITPVKVKFVYKEEFGYRTKDPGVRSVYERPNARFDDVSRMLTGDLNIGMVQWSVQYTIKDPAAYLFNIRDPVQTLRDLSESVMREIIGDRSVTEIITEGRKEASIEMQSALQKVLDQYDSGIQISQVILTDVAPPKEVKNSFNEVNQAQQEMEQTVNRALQDYNQAIPRARGEALKMVNEAEGYQMERINRAEGDVARFRRILEEYNKSPDITRRRLYLETMEEILPLIEHKIILDEETRSILPLLNLKAEGGAR